MLSWSYAHCTGYPLYAPCFAFLRQKVAWISHPLIKSCGPWTWTNKMKLAGHFLMRENHPENFGWLCERLHCLFVPPFCFIGCRFLEIAPKARHSDLDKFRVFGRENSNGGSGSEPLENRVAPPRSYRAVVMVNHGSMLSTSYREPGRSRTEAFRIGVNFFLKIRALICCSPWMEWGHFSLWNIISQIRAFGNGVYGNQGIQEPKRSEAG